MTHLDPDALGEARRYARGALSIPPGDPNRGDPRRLERVRGDDARTLLARLGEGALRSGT